MTTYPLATLAAQVTSTGISAPSYADIYQSLQASFSSIYGSDSYIAPDSQDGQMLAVFAQAINNANSATIAAYNAFSPNTAQGAGLASVVKINGIKKLVATNSSVNVTITGVAGTIINNGLVGDTNNNQWALPTIVTIPVSGSIIVTASSVTNGAVTAAVGTVSSIITPTLGWQSVNNTTSAITGAPVETDAALRVRQSQSTSLTAQTIIGSIYGNLKSLVGVTQVKIFENDTGSADSLGIPAHSISCVVLGGSATSIAQIIEQTKTPGTGTYGNTTQVVSDPVGVPVTINFNIPVQETITVSISIRALPNYTSTVGAQIVNSIVSYINNLGIYGNNGLLSLTTILAAAYNTTLPGSYNVILSNLLIAVSPNTPANTDIAIGYNQIPVCTSSNVTLIVT